MHGLDVIIRRNAEAAGRENAFEWRDYADNPQHPRCLINEAFVRDEIAASGKLGFAGLNESPIFRAYLDAFYEQCEADAEQYGPVS